MKFLLAIVVAVLAVQYSSVGKKHKIAFNKFDYMNDEVVSVETTPPEVTSECTCKCCDKLPAGQTTNLPKIKCPNDIVVAVDSSACFRDYHSQTISFLRKLNRRIGRQDGTKYGEDGTRLSLMQFSSDIRFAVNLSSFENYSNPSSSKALVREIDDRLSNLEFLGEGAFLNEALNATVDHFRNNPRPKEVFRRINQTAREIIIILTNGNSHPNVLMEDIENSINGLREIEAVVFPVSVTRECHFTNGPANEGLCPNTAVMNKLAQVGRKDGEFFEMKSQDTLPDILSFLKCISDSGSQAEACRNCTCSCEFKSLPAGPQGEKGEPGDSVKGEPGDRGENGTRGETGDKGEEGSKGDQGEEGEKGETGEQGEKGDSGTEGEQGEDGSKGEKGDEGEKGVPGEAASKGDQGEDGTRGDRGEKGDVGEKGDGGNEGEKGQKGDLGEMGEKGEKGMGEDGEPGAPGLDGDKGEPGDEGTNGVKGDRGSSGKCGKPGPAGTPGDLGLPGVDGRDGPPGARGRQGTRGDPGPRGQKGQSGEIGMDGTKGEPGQTGQRGPVGLAGNRGPKGTKGDSSSVAGPPGLPGILGEKGNRGDRGFDGTDGFQGPPGSQGPRGRNGPQGPAGEVDIERLRPLIVNIIRDMLPGECVSDEASDDDDDSDEASADDDGSDEASKDDGSGEPLPPDVTTTASTTTTSTTASTTTATSSTTTRAASTTRGFDEICQENPPFGNCFATGEEVVEEKFYWNAATQDCEAFSYRLCAGSNIFDSEAECLARCQGTITTRSPTFNTPGCRDARVGIAFVLDDSASVDELKFFQLKEFLNAVANQFSVFGPYGLQTAAISYNGAPIEEFGFNDTTTKSNLQNSIGRLQHRNYASGNSHTGRAIEFVGALFDDLGTTADTPQPTKVVIVITDGRSADDVQTPSTNLKRKDVLMFAVGADGAELVELEKIASQTRTQHVYRVPDYDGLSDISDVVVENICIEAKGTYSQSYRDEDFIELAPGN